MFLNFWEHFYKLCTICRINIWYFLLTLPILLLRLWYVPWHGTQSNVYCTWMCFLMHWTNLFYILWISSFNVIPCPTWPLVLLITFTLSNVSKMFCLQFSGCLYGVFRRGNKAFVLLVHWLHTGPSYISVGLWTRLIELQYRFGMVYQKSLHWIPNAQWGNVTL